MLFRCNDKDYPWVANHSYNLKRFINKSKISLPVRLALIFVNEDTPGTRTVILKKMGIERFENKGYLSGLFSAMTQNSILKYSHKDKSYIKGERYKEFLEDICKQITDLNLTTLYNKEYLELVKGSSQALHFILED